MLPSAYTGKVMYMWLEIPFKNIDKKKTIMQKMEFID